MPVGYPILASEAFRVKGYPEFLSVYSEENNTVKDRPNAFSRVHPVTTFSRRVECAGFGGHPSTARGGQHRDVRKLKSRHL